MRRKKDSRVQVHDDCQESESAKELWESSFLAVSLLWLGIIHIYIYFKQMEVRDGPRDWYGWLFQNVHAVEGTWGKMKMFQTNLQVPAKRDSTLQASTPLMGGFLFILFQIRGCSTPMTCIFQNDTKPYFERQLVRSACACKSDDCFLCVICAPCSIEPVGPDSCENCMHQWVLVPLNLSWFLMPLLCRLWPHTFHVQSTGSSVLLCPWRACLLACKLQFHSGAFSLDYVHHRRLLVNWNTAPATVAADVLFIAFIGRR